MLNYSLLNCMMVFSSEKMKVRNRKRLFFCWFLLFLTYTKVDGWKEDFSRDEFPPDFIFGASTSAYQVEGAAAEYGRKPSIWDTFTHAGKSFNGSTGDVTTNQYHHYKEDVHLMAKMGVDAYRFSISWSRLIPDGRGDINPKGLQYYNALIDELLRHGIEPHITLYHFDLPQSLEDAYGGWLSPQITKDFRDYAEVCFREFGDRVKYWITFNEPNVFSTFSYDTGLWPPQRCSYPFRILANCSAGNSTVEPYIVAHNVLLSHAAAVELYRDKFQSKQKGLIGLDILAMWFVPMTNASKDIVAAQRAKDFFNNWFIDPIVHGDYPSSMKEIVGSRLSTFTKQQSGKLRGSFDFIGLNHYNTFAVYDSSDHKRVRAERDFFMDMGVTMSAMINGTPIGKIAPSGIPIVPWGLQALLEYLKQHYDNPPIIIYENGYGELNNESLSLSEALNDNTRVEYLNDYLESVLAAIRNGSNTRGYFVWSLLDCFEFLYGYEIRYGFYHVDFKDEDQSRYPKVSVEWFTRFLHGKRKKLSTENIQMVKSKEKEISSK